MLGPDWHSRCGSHIFLPYESKFFSRPDLFCILVQIDIDLPPPQKKPPPPSVVKDGDISPMVQDPSCVIAQAAALLIRSTLAFMTLNSHFIPEDKTLVLYFPFFMKTQVQRKK